MSGPTAVKSPRVRRKRAGSFHHGDLAEQLALAAAELVERKGYQALTMKELAARLGVSDAAIYRHYASRDALLAEVGVRGFLRFIAAIEAALHGVVDPFESVARYGRAYVRFAVGNPGWFRLQFSRTAAEGLRQLPGVMERFAPAEEARLRLLQHWRAALPPGDDRVADLYRLVWGTVHGLAGFVVERVFQLVQTDEERIAAADVAIDLLVASLRARAAQPVAATDVAR